MKLEEEKGSSLETVFLGRMEVWLVEETRETSGWFLQEMPIKIPRTKRIARKIRRIGESSQGFMGKRDFGEKGVFVVVFWSRGGMGVGL